MQTTKYSFEGSQYEAEWDFVDDDNIVVYLPGGPRGTWLRGMDPDEAAQRHLKAYVHAEHSKK